MRGAAPKKTLPVVSEGKYSAFAGAFGVTDGDGCTSLSWEPPGKAAKRPRKADAEEPTPEMDVEELIPLPPGQSSVCTGLGRPSDHRLGSKSCSPLKAKRAARPAPAGTASTSVSANVKINDSASTPIFATAITNGSAGAPGPQPAQQRWGLGEAMDTA
ncbi:hypothetical protein WN48_09309 [Eufriesea mexicana]|uniref:Uncharacterized protein n=1 Tax=Eufriesea mexicana TaxID=516756 RepID=A0A310S9Z4_9HYME|nr:hypothetical protein WN48_09309 [Eufriesea mexicana]